MSYTREPDENFQPPKDRKYSSIILNCEYPIKDAADFLLIAESFDIDFEEELEEFREDGIDLDEELLAPARVLGVLWRLIEKGRQKELPPNEEIMARLNYSHCENPDDFLDWDRENMCILSFVEDPCEVDENNIAWFINALECTECYLMKFGLIYKVLRDFEYVQIEGQ